ncbi:MAG: energy-coupling factor transporter transmembrane protein EcfT [Pseudorhodobacter sp.]
MLTLTCPVETPLHRISAGTKLLALAGLSIGLFSLQNLWLILAAGMALAGLYLAFGRVFARFGAVMLRPLWPFMAVLALWHGWTGEWALGLAIGCKMLVAVGMANLVTMTTRLDDMISVVETATAPLARFGVKPRLLAVAIALVVRFTPVLMDKAGQLGQAWRARSPKRANWQIVLPISLMALDDADRVAEAMRARGGM